MKNTRLPLVTQPQGAHATRPADPGVSAATEPARRVRVWFGRRLIFDYVADPDLARRYEEAMRRRCAGLRITNEPVRGTTAMAEARS